VQYLDDPGDGAGRQEGPGGRASGGQVVTVSRQ